MSRWPATKNRPAPRIEDPGGCESNYFEDFMIGAGAGAAFGQQETAISEAAAARMASLAIFIVVVSVVVNVNQVRTTPPGPWASG